MSWRTSEYSWAYRDGKPGLPCLAWRATILRYLSLDAPGHVIFLPGRWIECRAQLQIMKPVFGSSCDSAWSAGAPIALASLTQNSHTWTISEKLLTVKKQGWVFTALTRCFFENLRKCLEDLGWEWWLLGFGQVGSPAEVRFQEYVPCLLNPKLCPLPST